MSPTSTKKKRVLKYCLSILVLSSLGVIALITYQGKKLASPDRRALQAYHYEWLQEPEKHGISVTTCTQLNGMVPCLIVAPDISSTLGKRGKLVRQQVHHLGHKLQPHGHITGSVVLLHGRNGRKEDLLPVAERFCAVGLRCIIPDLPAHGESPVPAVQFGLSDWERDLPYRLLTECAQTFKFSPTPSAIWGMSMGGSFATHSAASGAPWKSIVIVSSFDRLDNVLDKQCVIPFSKDLLYSTCKRNGGAEIEKVTPSEWAKSIITPVLVAHGNKDQLIDLSYGKNLYQAFASTDKKWVEVDGGDHHNVLTTPMPLYATMAAWILQHLENK